MCKLISVFKTLSNGCIFLSILQRSKDGIEGEDDYDDDFEDDDSKSKKREKLPPLVSLQ